MSIKIIESNLGKGADSIDTKQEESSEESEDEMAIKPFQAPVAITAADQKATNAQACPDDDVTASIRCEEDDALDSSNFHVEVSAMYIRKTVINSWDNGPSSLSRPTFVILRQSR